MLFDGRNRIRFNYSRWGWTRGGGKTWHGGADIDGLDDSTIHMPGYGSKSISGTVVTARQVTDKRNKTWEWGWYVCVKLDANQTPDVVNYLYFCHCDKLLVKVGQKVKTGDALAIMGNTGNAARTRLLSTATLKFAHLPQEKVLTLLNTWDSQTLLACMIPRLKFPNSLYRKNLLSPSCR